MKQINKNIIGAFIFIVLAALVLILHNHDGARSMVEEGLDSVNVFSKLDIVEKNENASPDIEIEGGFEGSNIYDVKKISNNYFTVRMRPDEPSDHPLPNHMFYWFYLKLKGAKDQTVTVDIINAEWMPSHWNNYRPVYTYSEDPNDLADHKWENITGTKRSGKTFRFTHTFNADTVHIALRYPYMYTYLEKYISLIETNRHVSVEVLGKTREERNIYAIVVTDKNYPDKEKKGIWSIAKEHASEQDGAWVIEGMMNYLLSDDPTAVSLRKNAIFYFIPVAAPDAAYYGRTVNPVTGFDISHRYSAEPVFKGRSPGMTEETSAIWKRAEEFVSSGQSIDIAAVLHNPHGEEENVWSLYRYNNKESSAKHNAFNQSFFRHLGNYTTKITGTSDALYSFVFIGRCKIEFGSIGFLLEINQHAKDSFLTIADLHMIGESFAKGAFDYFDFVL